MIIWRSFKCMHMCILYWALLMMHNPAWAALMLKTPAKGERKKIKHRFLLMSDSYNKNKLKGKIRIEQRKKKTCRTTSTSGQVRSVVCVCALTTEHNNGRQRQTHTTHALICIPEFDHPRTCLGETHVHYRDSANWGIIRSASIPSWIMQVKW